jgi:hypothetical protein
MIKPEDMPPLPSSTAFDFEEYEKQVEVHMRREVRWMFEEKRRLFQGKIHAGVISKDDALPFRERTPAALAVHQVVTWLQKHVLFKVAEKLLADAEILNLDDPRDRGSNLLRNLAKSVGGAEFFFDPDERRAWVRRIALIMSIIAVCWYWLSCSAAVVVLVVLVLVLALMLLHLWV